MCKIICVTNRRLVEGDFLERIKEIAFCNPYAIILREKDLTEEEYLRLADKVNEICELHGVKFIAHTFVRAAHGCVHLPLPICRPLDIEVGASCHSASDAVQAARLGCGYVTFGHVYSTDCKRDLPPRGLEELKRVCDAVTIPVYAIGGITPNNAPEVIAAGASGICIMSSAMRGDIARLMSEFNKKLR